MESIEGRAALVTGASGIRAAVARQLAATGVRRGWASKAPLLLATRPRTYRPEVAFRPVTEASWG